MTRTLQQQQKDLQGNAWLLLANERKFLVFIYFLADSQVPWLGAGIGLIAGVIIVLADFLYTNKPTLSVSLLG